MWLTPCIDSVILIIIHVILDLVIVPMKRLTLRLPGHGRMEVKQNSKSSTSGGPEIYYQTLRLTPRFVHSHWTRRLPPEGVKQGQSEAHSTLQPNCQDPHYTCHNQWDLRFIRFVGCVRKINLILPYFPICVCLASVRQCHEEAIINHSPV